MADDTHRDPALRTVRNERDLWETAERRGVKQARLRHPSGWLSLTEEKATRELLDLAIDADGSAEWQPDELVRAADASRERVLTEADRLVDLGVLSVVGGTYRPNAESIVRMAVEELDAAVAERTDLDERSGFRYVSQEQAVRLMIDALLHADGDRRLTQGEIHEEAGVSRKSVWAHVDRLTRLGVLTESGGEYAFNRGETVFGLVRALNAAVLGATLSPR